MRTTQKITEYKQNFIKPKDDACANIAGKKKKRKGVYHLAFRAPSHLQPSRDIYLPEHVSTRNPIGGVLSRGNVVPRGPNTLFFQRFIDKRRLASQRIRIYAAFIHYILRRCVTNTNVQFFNHCFGK
ncbi:hypothetical protein TRVL_09874 [Trypanosoma vivax]|nr:hypothetical protein TRVL_09874 [Trypanosoma vivax]